MKFRFPVNFIGITQAYKKGVHLGIDAGWNSNYGGKNQPIYAAGNGTVVQIIDNDKSGKSWGNLVKIDHGNNYYTLYAHLKQGVVVKKGQTVKTGDLIGYMGTSGHSTGNHLHYEVYVGGSGTGYRKDPLLYTGYTDNQVIAKSTQKEFKLSKYVEEPIDITPSLSLQKALNECGAGLVEDGIIGTKSKSAIKKYYSKTPVIKWVQTRLNELGYNCGKVDGISGVNTKSAIKKFQKDKKLTQDGIAGINTITKML